MWTAEAEWTEGENSYGTKFEKDGHCMQNTYMLGLRGSESTKKNDNENLIAGKNQ